jgi:phosphorylase kinase alpha/beta subunit
MLVLHNERLLDWLRSDYALTEIQGLYRFLKGQRTFEFPTLKTGLFSAAQLQDRAEYTGYRAVWIRDNVYVAYAHYLNGDRETAIRCTRSLSRWLQTQKSRFDRIIEQGESPNRQMDRIHIRFDGETLQELSETWNHAQNDALGYFLWFYCRLVAEGELEPNPEDIELISRLVRYFKAVRYWQDEDSGHWEEMPKIEASSIGVVVAGLRSLQPLLETSNSLSPLLQDRGITIQDIELLIQVGTKALDTMLPNECTQSDGDKYREADAALLFLIYPLQVVDESMGDRILDNVITHLQGEYGIRRYLGDSFWCRDYRSIPEDIRTSVSSDREAWLAERNRQLQPGQEAQWCLFDPIVSAIFGMKYQRDRQPQYLQQQTHYFNRAIGQLTASDSQFGAFKCPELYFLESGKYVPGDATPLLWTQANLRIAFHLMQRSLQE